MPSDIAELGLSIDSRGAIKATDDLKKLENQAEKTEGATVALGNTVKGATSALFKMGAAASAVAAAYSIKKTTEFKAAMSDLSAITGAVGKDLAFLEREAKRLGSTTTLSATQTAEAFKLIASAKPELLDDAAALSAVTEEVIKLSEASGTDLANAADTVGSSLNQFSADADEAGRFVNVLAAGAKFGSSAVNDTSLALKNAGTVAAGAGLSFEQTNAAIQTLAKVAIKGGEAGTGLRGVLLKLSTQTNDDFNPKIVGFTQSIKNLRDAELSDIEAKKLFGQESITSANALIKEADNLDVLTAKLTGTNTAMEQAATRTNNLAGDMKSLASATEGAGLAFGDILDPWLRSITQSSTEAAQGLTTFINLITNAEDQTALAVQISNVADEIDALKAKVRTAKEEGLNIAEIFLAGEDIRITGEAQIKELEKSMQALIERRNELLKPPEKAQAATAAVETKTGTSGALTTAIKQVEDEALIDGQAKADTIEREQTFLERMRQMKSDSLLSEEELVNARLERDQERLELSKERLIESGLSEAEAMQEIAAAKEALTEASEKSIADIKARHQTKAAKFGMAVMKGEVKGILDGLVAMTSGLAKNNKTLFEANKLFATGQVLVNGITQVSEAAKLPFPANIGATAFAIGDAAGRLAAVRSASFGGGGSIPASSAGGNAGANGSAITQPVQPVSNQNQGGGKLEIALKVDASAEANPAFVSDLVDKMTADFMPQLQDELNRLGNGLNA